MITAVKLAVTALVTGIVYLQAQLWLDKGSIPELYRLHVQIQRQNDENLVLAQRNLALATEIQDLKSNPQAVEEVARRKLGMIAADERFFLIIDRPQ